MLLLATILSVAVAVGLSLASVALQLRLNSHLRRHQHAAWLELAQYDDSEAPLRFPFGLPVRRLVYSPESRTFPDLTVRRWAVRIRRVDRLALMAFGAGLAALVANAVRSAG
jgi:hypothetical protein